MSRCSHAGHVITMNTVICDLEQACRSTGQAKKVLVDQEHQDSFSASNLAFVTCIIAYWYS